MNDEDAADAIQDTILSCWEKIHSLKQIKYFHTWLIRILINKCHDICRKREGIVSFEEYGEPAGEDRYNLELKEGKIIFADMGYGEGGYTGMLFHIGGDNISGVHLSLDKGELYSATFENSTEDALTNWLAQGAPDEDNNPDTHTIIVPSPTGEGDDTESPRNVTLYHCIKRGNAVSEGYDSEIYYGFYIPDDTPASADDQGDMAADYHRMLSIFDGSVLKVTITYTNGSSRTKEYDLTVTKLAQDESGAVTDREWTGGGEGAFVYGILAEEKI